MVKVAEKVRFGVVGGGLIGPYHMKAVLACEQAELVAICDVVPGKAEQLSNELTAGRAAAYTDYEKMLEHDGLDAVAVATPSGMHGPMAVAAAQAGKHVIVEKPPDVTLEKIDAMIDAAEKAGVKLGCIFQRRMGPWFQAAKNAVDSGALGKLVLGDAYLKFHRSQEYYDSGEWRGTWELDGGGCLMNQGIHQIDLLRWFMGDPESVYGHAEHLVRNIEVEDTAAAVVRWKCGAFGVIEGTTAIPPPNVSERIEIHGEHGSIRFDGEKIVEWNVEGADYRDFLPEGAEEAPDGGSTAADPAAVGLREHCLLINDFVQAILEDREPMIPGREGRKAVELVLAIYKSARTGEVVKFPL